jgi:hypothetical protein
LHNQPIMLWRMQGPRRVVAAAVYPHPSGRELRVFFEPEETGELLHSQVERFDFSVLEAKADSLHQTFFQKGWWDLP